MNNDLTPARRQYLAFKKKYPNAILFFRMGDFYETFDDDARLIAKELEIVLTSREMGKAGRVPLAGVPHHAAEGYIARLINKGYKVAICEQIGPVPATGIVEREVIRVVTPGTVVEPGLLSDRRNNYLAAVIIDGERAGLAYCDVSTGELAATQVSGGDVSLAIAQELARLQPAECLVVGTDGQAAESPVPLLPSVATHFTAYESWRFSFDAAQRALLEHFHVATLDGFGLQGLPLAVCAAGALLQYVGETQRAALAQMTQFSTYSTASFMVLDAATRRNLELTQSTRTGSLKGSLLGVLDLTRTAMGGRLLRRWIGQPLVDVAALNERLDAVDALYGQTQTRATLIPLLGKVGDLERLVTRIGQHIATPRDLVALKQSLAVVPEIAELSTALGTELFTEVSTDDTELGTALSTETGTDGAELGAEKGGGVPSTEVAEQATDTESAEEIWESLGSRTLAAKSGAVLRADRAHAKMTPPATPTANPKSSIVNPQSPIVNPKSSIVNRQSPIANRQSLDACPDVVSLIEQAIVADPPATLSDGGVIRAGFAAELDALHASSKHAREWIAGLERVERERTGIKSLKVGYNKVFGYYIEVSNANKSQTPKDYIRKQTLVGAERYITPDLKEYEALVLNAQERTVELETGLFRQVCDQIAAQGERILNTAARLARLDVSCSLAEAAVRNSYVRPTLTTDDAIQIVGGRHPVVETTLTDEAFVPNDIYLCNKDAQIIILTGPNMAGKSTYLRQAALIVLMAQIGGFVPARQATIGVVDRIFTRVGAQDDIATGQSTFMVEMVETALILHHATSRSLIVLDEIGRGTSTYDGLAIARAVVEYIHNHPRLGAKTLFATHYHELTELAKSLPRVRNFNVAVAEEGDHVIFLRKIVAGGADRSYGIHVAQLAGLPRTVIHRAQQVLEDLEKDEQGRGRKERMRQQMASAQLALFTAEENPIIEELRTLAITEMSPLEAINKLYEMQQKVGGRKD
jgi:DNA mismatch repair protein MutS